jgi:hypothetical protein
MISKTSSEPITVTSGPGMKKSFAEAALADMMTHSPSVRPPRAIGCAHKLRQRALRANWQLVRHKPVRDRLRS